MIVNQSDLVQIVARASSLSERFHPGLIEANTKEAIEPQIDRNRLNRWCEAIAQGNWEKFNKRLAWDGLDIDRASLAINSLPVVNVESLPDWAETLKEIIQTAADFIREAEKRANYRFPTDKQKPLPFEEVLLPAIFIARQKLLTRLGSLPLELIYESAYQTLERSLLYQLLNLSSKTLEFEFARFRPLGQSILNLIGKSATDPNQIRSQYANFVQILLKDGLLSFFKVYPVLGRLMATAVDLWVEATAKFLQRLRTDIELIQQTFQPLQYQTIGKVIEIEPSLSDPHNGGKSVIALSFECGLKLVYKPKGLGAEVAYTQFLDWCNQQGIPLGFKVLKVCDRQTHGWVEYVEHIPCESAAAAEHFYQRAGMSLCLLYALRVVDCHRENLIANGEHLVLIDMETLMHQEVNLIAELQEVTEAETTVSSQFADSVLRTGLIPRWEFGKNNRVAYDISALGSIDLENNSDRSAIPTNIPILDGTPLAPNNYLDRIIAGFEQMYRFLIEKREILLSADSPLAAMKNERVRFIFRATRIYWAILQKSFVPQFMQDGIERSIQLDILARAFLVASQKPDAWPIFHAETKAMEQLDIPYFAAYPNSTDISIGLERPIEGYFKEPSYQEVLTQFQNLNEIDLARQIEIIKGSFYARVVRKLFSGQTLNDKSETRLIEETGFLETDELIAEATRIATEIQERAIWGTDGSVKWISFAYVPNADRFQMMPLPEDLYNGNGGIALFLAALGYIKKTNQFQDLILGALSSIRKFLQTADFESTRRFVRCGIGGATGLGSIIYALIKTNYFLGETTLLEDALGIANLITPKLIAADQQFDTQGGAAGAILGLLALYAATGESKVLHKAIVCGQHLLAHQISINHAPKAWKILGQKQYTGFSHGAAGIAYALLRLYSVTRDRAYLEAASQGIAYEDSIFSPSAANWPDLRNFAQQNGQSGFMTSWCHGAAGIGLGRLGGLSILSTDEIQQDIEVALQTTEKHSLQDVDCVCCGNFGRIEMLLVAAQKLSRPQLREAARQKAAWVVSRAKQSGGYQFPHLPNSAFSPSFFQGTSGIGYELLRLAYPEALPSILLWD